MKVMLMVLSTPCTYTDIHVHVHQSNSCFKRDDYLVPLSVSALIYYAVTNTQKPQLQKKRDSLCQVLSQYELCFSKREQFLHRTKKRKKDNVVQFEQNCVPPNFSSIDF